MSTTAGHRPGTRLGVDEVLARLGDGGSAFVRLRPCALRRERLDEAHARGWW